MSRTSICLTLYAKGDDFDNTDQLYLAVHVVNIRKSDLSSVVNGVSLGYL